MNIQIFGTRKCFETKKAERYFKERNIRYQFIDMKEKGMSRGEFKSVIQSVGGVDNVLDDKCRDKDLIALLRYIPDADKEEKIFENQHTIKTPVVRNGKSATVGFQPDIWKNWE